MWLQFAFHMLHLEADSMAKLLCTLHAKQERDWLEEVLGLVSSEALSAC